ncbi:MAG: hypothetical protein O3B45_08590, partial [Bacteroidetes bacterium]|nr:hypothetical protein [Bacteroidota bacterium]
MWQLKRIRDDLDEYFNDFYHDKVRPPTESPSKPAAEGQSSLLVTVWGIYGLAAFIGSIILYFAFAQAWNPSDFIFSNNEGFVAALALLIIVLSGAIVPIYTDLAKQVRQQTDTFELEISSLCQTVAEIDIHATALWVHFERMAQETLMQWTESLGSEVIGRAAHDCLFKPFDIARNEQVDVSKKPDHYFQRWSETQVQTVPIPVLSDATKHLKGIEQLTKPTDTSVSKTRILRVFRITPKPEESLTYQERQTRTRRLRYIGWSAQGPLAIASYKTFLSTTEEGRVFHRTPFNEINPLIYRRYPPVDNEAEGVFLNGSKYLVPASENFIVEVLREQLRQQRETNGNFNLPDLEGNQLEFSKRCGRHLARWDSFEQSQEARSLRTSLSNACASLELDIAFFSDDMTLFNHLALNNREANPATNVGLFARFLYYSFWLIAPRQKTTIKEILEIFKVETSSKNDIEHRSTFSDLHGALLDFLNRDKHEDPIFTAVSRQTHAYGNLFPVLLERLFEKLAKKTNLVIGTLPEKRLREKFIESLSDDSNDADIKLFKAWLKHETFDNEIEITAEEFEVMGQKIFDEIKKNSKCNEFFSQETEWKIVGDEHNRKNTTEEFLYLSLADHQSALYNWMRAARSGEIRNDIIDFRERLKQHESRKQLGIDITPSRHDRLAHLQDFLKLPYQGGTLRVRSIYDLMPSTKEFHLKKQVTKNQTDQSYIPYLKMLKFSGLPKNKQKDCAMSDELQKNIYLSINDNKPIDPKHLGSSKFRETFLKWLLEALDVSSPALQKEPDVLTNVLRTMRLTHNKPELMDQYIERL